MSSPGGREPRIPEIQGSASPIGKPEVIVCTGYPFQGGPQEGFAIQSIESVREVNLQGDPGGVATQLVGQRLKTHGHTFCRIGDTDPHLQRLQCSDLGLGCRSAEKYLPDKAPEALTDGDRPDSAIPLYQGDKVGSAPGRRVLRWEGALNPKEGQPCEGEDEARAPARLSGAFLQVGRSQSRRPTGGGPWETADGGTDKIGPGQVVRRWESFNCCRDATGRQRRARRVQVAEFLHHCRIIRLVDAIRLQCLDGFRGGAFTDEGPCAPQGGRRDRPLIPSCPLRGPGFDYTPALAVFGLKLFPEGSPLSLPEKVKPTKEGQFKLGGRKLSLPVERAEA